MSDKPHQTPAERIAAAPPARRSHFLTAVPESAPAPAAPAAAEPDAGDGFSDRNPARRQQQVSLDLRRLGRKRLGLPYISLGPVLWEPSEPLVLDYPAFKLKVVIDGRNLEPLYLALLGHQARYVQQVSDVAAADKPDDATVITRIDVIKEEKERPRP